MVEATNEEEPSFQPPLTTPEIKEAAQSKETVQEEQAPPKEDEAKPKEPEPKDEEEVPPPFTDLPPLNTELPPRIPLESSDLLSLSTEHHEDDYFNCSSFITDVTLRRWSGQSITTTTDPEPTVVGATIGPTQEVKIAKVEEPTNAEPAVTIEGPV